jgi:hypothetical protein
MRQRQEDLESGEERRADCDWNWLLLSTPELNRGSRQWELVLELRQKLERHCWSITNPLNISLARLGS